MPKREFVCVRSCQYPLNKHATVFPAGDILVYAGEIVKCPDCEVTEGVCPTCKGCGRLDPPHHFKLLDTVIDKELKDPEVLKSIAKEDEIVYLRKRIVDLGGEYDEDWKGERLKVELVQIEENFGEKLDVRKQIKDAGGTYETKWTTEQLKKKLAKMNRESDNKKTKQNKVEK